MDATVSSEQTGASDRPSVPAESAKSSWIRRLVLLAFWAVPICLGLPHWNWTTSIPRSALPLDVMNAWAEGKQCQLHYPLQIRLQAKGWGQEQTVALSDQIQGLLTARNGLPLYSFEVVLGQRSPDDVLTVLLESQPSQDGFNLSLETWHPKMTVGYNLKDVDTASLASLVADEVSKLFDDESASLAHLLQDTPLGSSVETSQLSPEQQKDLDSRKTRAFKHASTYHLTFSLFTPHAAPSAWEIDQALNEHIKPLVRSFSTISDFTIDTQVQLYASFSPSISGPTYDNATQTWRLHYGDLTGFVNAAEWPLSPSIGSGPTINFVLYVPSLDKSPLVIDESSGTSWIIPQWGGVQIHNPSHAQADALTLDDLRPDMLVFADQFASLIGVPRAPPSLSLRISSLTRVKATALMISASSTLGALARLTLKLVSISIPESVSDSVDETIRRLDQACADIRVGQFESALENARIAEAEAEQAFFEPSMVGQVYFPEEHKVAVYVPLLGPMAVPMLMAGIKEIRSLRKAKRKAA